MPIICFEKAVYAKDRRERIKPKNVPAKVAKSIEDAHKRIILSMEDGSEILAEPLKYLSWISQYSASDHYGKLDEYCDSLVLALKANCHKYRNLQFFQDLSFMCWNFNFKRGGYMTMKDYEVRKRWGVEND